MDLPLPAAQQQQQRIQAQQRPSISYFVFLSLLFYLMNSNQPRPNGTLAFPPRDDAAFQHRLAAARADLLRREARAEGIARWLGASNSTTDYLNSTYYPALANGSAPGPPKAEGNSSTTNATAPPSTGLDAYPIRSYAPHSDGEVAPLPALVARLFADTTPRDEGGREEARVYPQNLTGYAKGGWEIRHYDWLDLGVNETWTTERVVQLTPDQEAADAGGNESPGNGTASTPSETRVPLARRQSSTSVQPSASTSASAAPTPATSIVVNVHNRTFTRGTFPWTATGSSSADIERRASFNLREVQTSAVGPIEALPTDPELLDEAALLRLKDHPEAWAEWERLGPVTYLWGPLTLSVALDEDGSGAQETELDVEAVHFLTSGRIYGYATPRFVRAHIVDAISLPLMSDAPAANQTAHAIGHAMLKEYRRRVEKDVRDLDENGPRIDDDSDDEAQAPSDDTKEDAERAPACIFSLYGALSPLPREYDWERYTELYASFFRPSGAALAVPPPSTLSAILSSPNCGLVLSIPDAKVTSTQALWLRAAHFGVLFLVGQGVSLVLLVRQLERAAARPGTLANVQPVGLIIVVIVDLYVFIVTVLVGVIADSRASLPFLGGAFLALLSSVLFGLRYIAIIREATPAPSPAPAPAPTVAANRSNTPSEQAPQAEIAATTSVLPEALGAVLARWRAKHTIMAATAALVLFIAINLLSHGWTPFFLWLLYSYWIPQIVLNVQRGTARQSLADEYVVGTTFARLMPPLYFWAYADNCLLVETTPKIYLLVAYSLLQAGLLLTQAHLSRTTGPSARFLPTGGARFFLPRFVVAALDLPETSSWDYHPRTRMLSASPTDLEVGGGGGGGKRSEAAAGAVEVPAEEEDCPICLSPVQVVPTKAQLAAGKADEIRRAAAITPCAHVVHTECLEQWMMVRAVCPVCRAGLPPLTL